MSVLRTVIQDPWAWGGIAFLVVGVFAGVLVPSPLGTMLAMLGLVVCAASVTGVVLLARHRNETEARSSSERTTVVLTERVLSGRLTIEGREEGRPGSRRIIIEGGGETGQAQR